MSFSSAQFDSAAVAESWGWSWSMDDYTDCPDQAILGAGAELFHREHGDTVQPFNEEVVRTFVELPDGTRQDVVAYHCWYHRLPKLFTPKETP